MHLLGHPLVMRPLLVGASSTPLPPLLPAPMLVFGTFARMPTRISANTRQQTCEECVDMSYCADRCSRCRCHRRGVASARKGTDMGNFQVSMVLAFFSHVHDASSKHGYCMFGTPMGPLLAGASSTPLPPLLPSFHATCGTAVHVACKVLTRGGYLMEVAGLSMITNKLESRAGGLSRRSRPR